MTEKQSDTTTADTTCDRCDECAERGEAVLAQAESERLIDGENPRDVQILDLIVNLRHRYDQLPDAEREYATWQDLIDSVGIHYDAERRGEDCDASCPRHRRRDGDDDSSDDDDRDERSE